MSQNHNITTIAQQLRALHEKTTPLKWFENEGDLVGDRGYALLADFRDTPDVTNDECDANARFTAFAHNNAPAICEALEAREWKFPALGDLPPLTGLAKHEELPDVTYSANCEIVFDGELFYGYLAQCGAAPYWVLTSDSDNFLHALNSTAWRYAEDVSELVIPEVPKC